MAFSLGEMKLCPYGHLSWITPAMAFFAMWMFLFPAYRCSLTVSQPPGTDVEIFVGYWSRERSDLAYANIGDDGNTCVGWNNKDYFDGVWKFGRGMGVLGSITCPLTLLADFLLIFMRFPLKVFYPLLGMHVVNATLSALLLVALGSYVCEIDYCRMARGAYVAIIAAVFWLILAFLIYLVRKREMELPDPNEDKGLDEEPYYEEDEDPDVEQPLALPAPPPKSPKKKKAKEPERLALPPSENSSRRRQQPASPKKKSADDAPLALPMSEGSTRSKKPSSKKSSSGESGTKKKKKKPEGDAPLAITDGTAPKPRKKRTPKKKPDA
mmetsp:Transcript_51952/g.78913  ORF Transcript_51952/g.78913 Transcript_51952/m.78913 type:complete len:325 (+) Transcript_51952:34-1008(+)